MALLYICLGLLFSGFLFISTQTTIQKCEIKVIPLKNKNVSTNIIELRHQSNVKCFCFGFYGDLVFEENEQKILKIELIGGENFESDLRIDFMKDKHMEWIKRTIKFSDDLTAVNFEFIFDVANGVMKIKFYCSKNIFLCLFVQFFYSST